MIVEKTKFAHIREIKEVIVDGDFIFGGREDGQDSSEYKQQTEQSELDFLHV